MSILQPHRGYNISGYDPNTSPVMYPFKWRGCLVRPLSDSAAIMHYLGPAYNDLQKAKLEQARLLGGADVVVSTRSSPWAAWHVMSIAGNDILTIWVPPPEKTLEEPGEAPKLLPTAEWFVAWDIVKDVFGIDIDYAEMEVDKHILIQDVRVLDERQFKDWYAFGSGLVQAVDGSFVTPMHIGELEPSEVISRKYLEHIYPHYQGWDLWDFDQHSYNRETHAPDCCPPIYPPNRPCYSWDFHAQGWMYTWHWDYTITWPIGEMKTSDFWSGHLGGHVPMADHVYGCPTQVGCYGCRELVLKPAIGPNRGTRCGGWGTTQGLWQPQTEEKGTEPNVFDVYIISEDTRYVRYSAGSEEGPRFQFGSVNEDGSLLFLVYSLIHDWVEDWELREWFFKCEVEGATYDYKHGEDHPYSETERMDFEFAVMECTIYEWGNKVWFLTSTMRREFPWDGNYNEEYFLQYHVITYEDDEWIHHKSREFQGSLQSYEGDTVGTVESRDGVTHSGWIPFSYIDPDTQEEVTKYNPGTFRLVRTVPATYASG